MPIGVTLDSTIVTGYAFFDRLVNWVYQPCIRRPDWFIKGFLTSIQQPDKGMIGAPLTGSAPIFGNSTP